MSNGEHGAFKSDDDKNESSDKSLIEKIEEAYRIYKLSEVFFNDVADDYGKQKIAALRMEFARHHLDALLEEARGKGVKWNESEIVKKFLYPGALKPRDKDWD